MLRNLSEYKIFLVEVSTLTKYMWDFNMIAVKEWKNTLRPLQVTPELPGILHHQCLSSFLSQNQLMCLPDKQRNTKV